MAATGSLSSPEGSKDPLALQRMLPVLIVTLVGLWFASGQVDRVGAHAVLSPIASPAWCLVVGGLASDFLARVTGSRTKLLVAAAMCLVLVALIGPAFGGSAILSYIRLTLATLASVSVIGLALAAGRQSNQIAVACAAVTLAPQFGWISLFQLGFVGSTPYALARVVSVLAAIGILFFAATSMGGENREASPRAIRLDDPRLPWLLAFLVAFCFAFTHVHSLTLREYLPVYRLVMMFQLVGSVLTSVAYVFIRRLTSLGVLLVGSLGALAFIAVFGDLFGARFQGPVLYDIGGAMVTFITCCALEFVASLTPRGFEATAFGLMNLAFAGSRIVEGWGAPILRSRVTGIIDVPNLTADLAWLVVAVPAIYLVLLVAKRASTDPSPQVSP